MMALRSEGGWGSGNRLRFRVGGGGRSSGFGGAVAEIPDVSVLTVPRCARADVVPGHGPPQGGVFSRAASPAKPLGRLRRRGAVGLTIRVIRVRSCPSRQGGQ